MQLKREPIYFGVHANRMKTIFVLSGGNTKGSWQIGVCYQLMELLKIKPDVIIGTSIGATNACMIRQLGIDQCVRLWSNVRRRSDFVHFNWDFWKGLFNTNGLKDVLIKSSKEPLVNKEIKSYAAVINSKNSITEYFSNEDKNYLNMVLASACEPVFFEPTDGYVDAGLDQFLPYTFAREQYPDANIYCISTMPFREFLPRKPAKINLYGMLGFAVDLLTFNVGQSNMEKAILDPKVTLYCPDRQLQSSLVFDNDVMLKGIELGINALPIKEMNGEAR